jgi:hypothetical protein
VTLKRPHSLADASQPGGQFIVATSGQKPVALDTPELVESSPGVHSIGLM